MPSSRGPYLYPLRSRIARFEQAAVEPADAERQRLLTVLVVGGGFTGVEAAGHLFDLMRNIHPFYPQLSRTRPRMALLQRGLKKGPPDVWVSKQPRWFHEVIQTYSGFCRAGPVTGGRCDFTSRAPPSDYVLQAACAADASCAMRKGPALSCNLLPNGRSLILDVISRTCQTKT